MAGITTAPKPSRRDTVAARQARFGATAGLYTIVVIAVLVLVNWLGNRYNKTYDTTSNKRFTLSQETQKIVKGLKQDATINILAYTEVETPWTAGESDLFILISEPA